MPVDLLWNGGIGTYVKASAESHAEVGDRANDAVRIDAGELRARVVAEGGNLGFTQAARVEAALRGRAPRQRRDPQLGRRRPLGPRGQLQDPARAAAALRARSRPPSGTRRCSRAADDACESVLAHNRAQSLVPLPRRAPLAQADPQAFLFASEYLCESTGHDRRELELPDAAELAGAAQRRRGFTRPELAVLLGLAKLHVRGALGGDALLDRPELHPLLVSYFPARFRERWPEAAAAAPAAPRDHGARAHEPADRRRRRHPGAVARRAPGHPRGERRRGGPRGRGDPRCARLSRRGSSRPSAPPRAKPSTTALRELSAAVLDVARHLLASGARRARARRPSRTGARASSRCAPRCASSSRRARRPSGTSAGGASPRAGSPQELADEVASFPLADRGLNVVRILERTGLARPRGRPRLRAPRRGHRPQLGLPAPAGRRDHGPLGPHGDRRPAHPAPRPPAPAHRDRAGRTSPRICAPRPTPSSRSTPSASPAWRRSSSRR